MFLYALLNLNSICWWCWNIVTDEREVDWKSVKSPRRQANYQCLIPLTQSNPGGMTGFATVSSLKTDIEWVLLWVFIILICNNDLTAISHPVSMFSFKSMRSLPVYLLFVFVHSEVYLIRHYVIKFVSDLRQVSGFLWVLRVSSTNKTDHHDITEILLKVALNTVNLNLNLRNNTTLYFLYAKPSMMQDSLAYISRIFFLFVRFNPTMYGV